MVKNYKMVSKKYSGKTNNKDDDLEDDEDDEDDNSNISELDYEEFIYSDDEE